MVCALERGVRAGVIAGHEKPVDPRRSLLACSAYRVTGAAPQGPLSPWRWRAAYVSEWMADVSGSASAATVTGVNDTRVMHFEAGPSWAEPRAAAATVIQSYARKFQWFVKVRWNSRPSRSGRMPPHAEREVLICLFLPSHPQAVSLILRHAPVPGYISRRWFQKGVRPICAKHPSRPLGPTWA